jgi:DNA-binding GntR family transcriptional regulator
MTGKPTGDAAQGKGVAHDVYGLVREMIVQGMLAPGAPLIERSLATRLGVSRGSLRSALQRLEHEGFVRSFSAGKYSRAVVAPLTVADMEEIYTLIAVLDGVAARQAARLPDAQRERLAQQLEALNTRLAKVLDSSGGDFSAVYEIDHQLHFRYVEAAGAARLLALYSAISSQGERYGRAYASAMGYVNPTPGQSFPAVLEHEAILDAIRAGDADAAERAAVTNWHNAAARFRRVIAAAGERGSF